MLKLSIKDILRQRPFSAIAVISGIGIGFIYYFLTLYSVISHFEVESGAMPYYIATSIGLTIAVSILAGINTSLVVYNIKTQKTMNLKKGVTSAVLGGALTAFTPGCPACTTSLSAILGIVGGLAIFPLYGLELKFISITALVFSIWWAMRSINNASCCLMKE